MIYVACSALGSAYFIITAAEHILFGNLLLVTIYFNTAVFSEADSLWSFIHFNINFFIDFIAQSNTLQLIEVIVLQAV